MRNADYEASLEDWSAKLAAAEGLVPVVGRLYRDNNVVTSIYGRSLVNQSPIAIIKHHRYGRHVDETELPVAATMELLTALQALDPGSASIDVPDVLAAHRASGMELTDFLRALLGDVAGANGAGGSVPRDVVLYGFGRIGRLLARILIAHAGRGGALRLRAIVVRRNGDEDLIKRASLLRRDSVHGSFDGTITVDAKAETITANGCPIQVIYSTDPSTVDYERYGIDNAIVVDNTGRWRDETGLSQHLACPGVARVLLTAPGTGGIKNIVHGINHGAITDEDRIIAAASCTTNAVAPVAAALHERFGIAHGHIETVHSFTNDQNLIDNFHKGSRRGRAATLNMVITETGAATAVAQAVPALAGRLSGSAIRVPTPDVSIAVLTLNLERPSTAEEINAYVRELSLHSALHRQIGYIESPEVVSTDFLGSRQAGVIDGLATQCNGTNAVVYVWYDNEFGYSSQVIRVIEHLAHADAPAFRDDDGDPYLRASLAVAAH
jgi:glyceraldehyde 3-phosphate dehydrogenase